MNMDLVYYLLSCYRFIILQDLDKEDVMMVKDVDDLIDESTLHLVTRTEHEVICTRLVFILLVEWNMTRVFFSLCPYFLLLAPPKPVTRSFLLPRNKILQHTPLTSNRFRLVQEREMVELDKDMDESGCDDANNHINEREGEDNSNKEQEK
jgi:hypothetical protein